ncbi:DUF11 domain-containing protein [Nocardioides alcanivorans]|uniref:DUF11 domain-containing protein n=1 Tax=Nocardioides alcanivorans TaxID=2897352 RepID=UPI001F27C72D|nr:DUF11 domain-containing protein [Nocardioides alcanivorans]
MSFGFAASSVPRRPGVARRAILSALAALLVVLGLPLLSVTSAHAAPNSLEIDKTVDNATPSPGQTFTYTIQVRCSEDDCLDAQITDQFPAELDGFEIQDVSFSPNASNVPRVVTWSTGADEPTTLGPDTQLTVDLQQVTDSPVGVGLKAGQTYRIQVSIKVPDDYGPPGTSPEIINTAAVSASNANTKTDNAIIQIETPIDIAVAVDKAWTPNRQDFDPGATSTIELDARNTSNVAVDQIVVQEPKTAPDGASSLQASNPFTITDFTGFSGTSLPAGCTDVKVDAYVFANGTWSWIEGDAVPAPTLALPNGVANGDVGGVRITCLGEIEQGESLSFGLDLEQRATHRNDGGDLSLDTHTVDNIATGSVTMDDDTVADDGNATYTVVPLIPSVEASKNIAPGRITAGQSSAATISATNGNTPVVSMHIEDLDFFTADVTFGGFDGPLTWPAAADSATVTYHLLDGGTETITVSQGQVPAPPSGDISGFEIDWTGAIRANETGERASPSTRRRRRPAVLPRST